MKVLNGRRYKQSSKRMPTNCGRSMKWKEPAANRTLLATTNRRANTHFMIVQLKVRQAGEVLATTVKRWSPGKKTSQKITLPIWHAPWALNFSPKTSIESCRNLDSSTRKRRAG